jgi:hypothetical protein
MVRYFQYMLSLPKVNGDVSEVLVRLRTISIEYFNATDIGAIGVEASSRSASALVVARRSGRDMAEREDDIDHENCERHVNGVKML